MVYFAIDAIHVLHGHLHEHPQRLLHDVLLPHARERHVKLLHVLHVLLHDAQLALLYEHHDVPIATPIIPKAIRASANVFNLPEN